MTTKLRAFVLITVCMLLAVSCATGRVPDDDEGMQEPSRFEPPILVSDLQNLLYTGTVRAKAKTTLVTTSAVYHTIADILALTAPDVGSTSDRTGVEDNAASFVGYLYAYNLPTDNDFHLIVGTDAFYSATTPTINVEISGISPAQATPFRIIRSLFLTSMNVLKMTRQKYVCVVPPKLITVTGGVFWDTQHPKGLTIKACGGLATTSGWEVHPATLVITAPAASP